MSEFRTKEISLKVQKKLFGSFAKKSVAKLLIDDTSANLLDNLNRLAKHQCNKKDADKIIKHIIKIIMKIAILHRNNQFNDSETRIAEQFKDQFHVTAMTIVSFHDVDFSYDRNYAIEMLNKCKILLKELVSRHLTDKSLNRIETVFTFFTRPEFVDNFFRTKDGDLKELRCNIIADMNKLLDNKIL